MRTITLTCHDCCGLGHKTLWRFVPYESDPTIGTADPEEIPCETCNGTGHVEMACFTKEEAEKILKHCGLEE